MWCVHLACKYLRGRAGGRRTGQLVAQFNVRDVPHNTEVVWFCKCVCPGPEHDKSGDPVSWPSTQTMGQLLSMQHAPVVVQLHWRAFAGHQTWYAKELLPVARARGELVMPNGGAKRPDRNMSWDPYPSGSLATFGAGAVPLLVPIGNFSWPGLTARGTFSTKSKAILMLPARLSAGRGTLAGAASSTCVHIPASPYTRKVQQRATKCANTRVVKQPGALQKQRR